MSEKTYESPSRAPNYRLHREVSSADAAGYFDDEKSHGMLMQDYEHALIQVIPADGANPDVEVLWWSEEAGQFIQDHTPISLSGVGADTPFEFSVQSLGRRLWVKVPTLATGSVKILIAGFSNRLS